MNLRIARKVLYSGRAHRADTVARAERRTGESRIQYQRTDGKWKAIPLAGTKRNGKVVKWDRPDDWARGADGCFWIRMGV